MAQTRPTTPDPTGEPAAEKPRKRAARYAVPVAVAGVAAATLGLVPALAAGGSPDLPEVTAEELVAKMAASDVERLSGTVRVSTDLGLPEVSGLLGGTAGGDRSGGPFGGGERGKGEDAGPAAPGDKLMELASGEHTLRVAADGPDKQRVSVREEADDYTVVRNGKHVWTYDSASNSALHGISSEGSGHTRAPEQRGPADLTPRQAAEKALDLVDDTTSVSVDGTAKVAGRDAYRLVIAPKDATHSTVGSLRVAVDADNGAPLQFTLTSREGGKPIVDIAYTEVDFGKPEAGTFSFTPPKGAKVTEQRLDSGKRSDGGGKSADRRAHPKGLPGLAGEGAKLLGDGWGTVAELKLPKGDAKRPGGGLAALEDVDDPRAQRMLDGFTDKVNGTFGTGRVFETRLFNVLLTEDGVYAGAVTKQGLIEAAEKAR